MLEIREYHLRLEKFKNETVKKIDDTFKHLITTLKKRKNELISDVLEKFSLEKEKVLKEENQWTDKQEISERLLGLMSEQDEQNILMNSKFILSGLRSINDPVDFKKIQIFNDLDTSLHINKTNGEDIKLNLEEIIYYFSNYLNIRTPNVLEYKA